MSRPKRAKYCVPEPTGISLLADELLMRIFQHCSFVDKVKRLPLVCKRWRQVCGDAALWKVIDIHPAIATNRAMQKIIKTYSGKHTKVLRIHQSLHSGKVDQKRSRVITQSTWNIIMKHCTQLEELYLEQVAVDSFKEFYSLPDTLRRLYVICCHQKNPKKSHLLSSISNHKSLELISTRHTPTFFVSTCKKMDLSVLTSARSLKYMSFRNFWTLEGASLEDMKVLSHITHLDLSNSRLFHYPDVTFKAMFNVLPNLLMLDISSCNIPVEQSVSFDSAWIDLWTGNVPFLKQIIACGVKLVKNDEEKDWFDLADISVQRPGMLVIGCRVKHDSNKTCQLDSIIPDPTTFIPLM